MKDTIMKTDRMILRKMRRDDAENLLEIFSDPTAMEYYPSTKNENRHCNGSTGRLKTMKNTEPACGLPNINKQANF